MIDVGELIFDPDFCTEFKIHRKISGERHGGRQTETNKIITVTGVVSAVSSKDMEMLPDGDRAHGLKTFYCAEELRLTSNEVTADICEYKGQRYRLLQVYDYSNNGYYKAIGTLIGGV